MELELLYLYTMKLILLFLFFLKLSKRIPIYIIYVKQILIFMAERNKEKTAQKQKGYRENSGPDWNSYWYPRGC